MGKNSLILHIGTEKTGSTALQKFLYKNAKKLEVYGWCYPKDKVFMKDSQWHNGIGFYEKGNKIDVTSPNWKKIWEYLLEYLDKANVILSAEEISVLQTQELIREIKKKYDNVKVVIYLRRQDKFVESLWNQAVKSQNMCYEGSVQDYLEKYCQKGTIRYEKLHYYQEVESIAKIIGKENVIVRVYEKQQFEGQRHDVISDFFSAIGINVDWEKFEDFGKVNLRISGNDLMIKQEMNQIINKECGYIYKTEVSKLFRNQMEKNIDKVKVEEGYFTKEKRIEILEEFQEENQLVAREYLNREDGRLFYDMNVDIPQYISPATSFEEDVIRIFTSMICEQNRKIDRLQILFQKGQRKLAYFGAGEKGKKLLQDKALPVELFLDNDTTKSGTLLNGIEIINAKEIEDWSEYFVVITCVQTCEIEEQLQQYGLKKEADYILAKDYFIL